MANDIARTLKNSEKETGGNPTPSFDVRSWQGLTNVLKAGRDAGLDPIRYADFRDAVLQYAQSGGTDLVLRKKIESTLQEIGQGTISIAPTEAPASKSAEERTERKLPVTSSVTPESTPKNETGTSFGMKRGKPQFGVQNTTSTVSPSKTTPSFIPHNLPVHTGDELVFVEVPLPPVSPTPPEPVTPPIEEKPASAPAVPETPIPRTIKTVDEYKARIADIKHTVNAEIGNPVTLLDTHNAEGKAYMQALLGAMKAVNGGAPGTLVSSMNTLESAFLAVMKVVAEDAQKPQATVSQEPEPVAPQKEETKLEPEVVVETVVPPSVVTPPAPQMQVPPVAPPATETEERFTVPVTPPEIDAPESIRIHATPQAFPSFTIPERFEDKKAEPSPFPTLPDLAPIKELSQEVVEEVWEPTVPQSPLQEKIEEPVVIPPRPTPPPVTSIQEEPRIPIQPDRTATPKYSVTLPGDAPRVVPDEVRDDLMAPEIESGLEQLLADWGIFNAGGMFKSGPRGRAHPLYQTLGPLPMSQVVAGHWDNADKEVMFSIRDYVNGWRHEQGISYVPSETFDHYLRRVIRRILKRQG